MSKFWPLGATVTEDGIAYRVWAPGVSRVSVDIRAVDGRMRSIPLEPELDGYHIGRDENGCAGDAYLYHLPGKGNFPDPASRAQQDVIDGRSLVVDWKTYSWKDTHWRRPCFRDLVIYELHIGTFTQEGTFQNAAKRLPLLRELGVTAIEIMPIGDFPGMRNWGYDGVLPYAPARCYGTPDDLRMLVDSAHSYDLAVILDVVYNHFGPRGNYLSCFTPLYFNKEYSTPWGDAFNFDSTMCGPVREFFVRNPIYWMEEFHMDGFRLDATHAIHDSSWPHILAEITENIHSRGGYAIAEDERNKSSLVESIYAGGLGFDGVWADDFHHIARVSQTREKTDYFSDYEGSLEEMIATLDCGWLYQGQFSHRHQSPRGTSCKHLAPEKLIYSISNHDQTGNHAFGRRLSHLVSPAAYRTLSALLCLSPYTPLIFMGQEWAASTPFLYFTDHEADFGIQITEGRRREFSRFPEFANARIPDPQSEDSFLLSKLRWEEVKVGEHAEVWRLYSECLQFRRAIAALRPTSRKGWHVESLSWGVGTIHYTFQESEYVLVFDLRGNHTGFLGMEGDWTLLLSTEETRFGGSGKAVFDSKSGEIRFLKPGLVFLSRSNCGVSSFPEENCKGEASQGFGY